MAVAHFSMAGEMRWTQLPAVPDRIGFAGPFAGVADGVLIVAGGANFPDKMPWEGGVKIWYDTIFALEGVDQAWKPVGCLPRPLGYGVSLSTARGIVCVGGSDAHRHYADCFLLRRSAAGAAATPLPTLPRPCANFCGAVIGDTIYVAGGLEEPNATRTLKTFWSLDLSAPTLQWQEREPWPGPARMLATAAVVDGGFYLVSGTDLAASPEGKPIRTYLKDAYCYRPTVGWEKLPDLPRSAVAAPTPAPNWGAAGFLILGGDDGSMVDFQPPEKHPGFPKSVLGFDVKTRTWANVGAVPVAHVTTPTVRWRDRWIVPTGEVRPGVRSPVVWSLPLDR